MSTATEPAETQSQIHVQTDRGMFLDDSFHDLPSPAERGLASTSATSTKDEDIEDIDDSELSKFKDFLEETVSVIFYRE